MRAVMWSGPSISRKLVALCGDECPPNKSAKRWKRQSKCAQTDLQDKTKEHRPTRKITCVGEKKNDQQVIYDMWYCRTSFSCTKWL